MSTSSSRDRSKIIGAYFHMAMLLGKQWASTIRHWLRNLGAFWKSRSGFFMMDVVPVFVISAACALGSHTLAVFDRGTFITYPRSFLCHWLLFFLSEPSASPGCLMEERFCAEEPTPVIGISINYPREFQSARAHRSLKKISMLEADSATFMECDCFHTLRPPHNP